MESHLHTNTEFETLFYLPIGDWSGDGHEHCIKYLVRSNKSIEEVREAHFNIQKATGVNIETLCAQYEEDAIPVNDAAKLRALGFNIVDDDDADFIDMEPDDMVALWMFLLQKSCPGLVLERVDEPEYPMLPFYGYDDQRRHIGQVGYGLF